MSSTRAPLADQTIGSHTFASGTRDRRWYRWFTELSRHPSATLAGVGACRSGRRTAGAALLLVAAGYSLVELFLYLAEWTPIPGPALRIPTGEFYAWAAVLCTPSMLGAWLLATALMQLLARWAGGRGAFERLAAATALATAVGTSASMIPDLVTSSLGIYDNLHGTWVALASNLIFLPLQVALLIGLYAAALRTLHRLSRSRAAAIAVSGYLTYQGLLFLLFLR
jgi:Yip1 domain